MEFEMLNELQQRDYDHLCRKRAIVTSNRKRTLLNGSSSSQRKSCAVEDGDEGDLQKDHTHLHVLKLELFY